MTKSRHSYWIACAFVSLAWGASACGDDKKKDDCPDGAICDDGGSGGTAGSGTAGSGTAGSGTAGSGTAGSGSAGTGSAGTGSAGTGSAGTGSAGTGSAGTGSAAVDKPKADGSELASCDPDAAMACTGELACYDAANATSVGFCTKTCTQDTDCSSLGASFTCSSPTGQAGTQYCRQSCTGEDDTSCPMYMACLPVQGGFRCLYDEKDVGTGTGKAWDECEQSGDCEGELVCYPSGAQGFGGTRYAGACTKACLEDADCDAPSTGNVVPSCGGGGNCVLDCAPAGGGMGAADGGTTCPEGMDCANLGGGRMRCMYVDTTGGV
jgi:hypothetical protein